MIYNAKEYKVYLFDRRENVTEQGDMKRLVEDMTFKLYSDAYVKKCNVQF